MRYFIIILFAILGISIFAQKNGHEIQFTVSDLPNGKIVVAHHYAGKHYITDTVRTNAKGIGYLKGDNKLTHGVYLAVFPAAENKHFEFIIGSQKFEIETKIADLHKNLNFKNSIDNELFYKDIEAMTSTRKQIEGFKKQLETAEDTNKKKLETQIELVNKKFLNSRNRIMDEFPDIFYTKLLMLMKEIQIPEAPKDEEGNLINPAFAFHYYRGNYWKYTDFSEEGILRTPVFHNKLMEFFDKYSSPEPDSLIASCDIVLKLAEQNDEVFKYTLVHLLNKYANSKIMGHDGVYVHLVMEYYAKGKAPWTEEEQLKKILERANSLKPLLIGNISPDLVLRDTSLNVKFKLHDLPFDFTIVYVWDPECGHCKKSAPVINDFLKKHKDVSIMVYGISTVNTEKLDVWKKFIQEKNLNWINVADPYYETNFRKIYDIASTPQIFVLDKNKKIIAKRIGANQLEDFFHNYLKAKEDDRHKQFKQKSVSETFTDEE